MMGRDAGLAILALGALALTVRAQAPAPQPVFRSGTDLVQVDVSVLDGKRRPVRGLSAADFTVLEDGQPREIQAFTEVDLPSRRAPGAAAWTRQVPSDVSSNAVAQQQGRLVIVVMDRSIPVGEPTVTARRVATQIINELGPDDLAAVVSTANGAVQNLTTDRTRLLRALSRGDLSTDISDEAKEIEASVFALTGRTWNALNDPRCTCGLCVLEAITRVADAVQSSSRRKLLFFIGSDVLLQTAGAPGEARQDVGCEHRLDETRESMLAAVGRANLTVHSLDPLGLANQSPMGRASSTLSGAAAGRGNASATMSNLQRQGNLEVLPDRTGGRAVLNTNAPEAAVPALFRESEAYYLLGFRPGNSSHDGRFHQITVKTARRGLDVRARSGYSMPLNTTSVVSSSAAAAITTPVREALTGLLPATAVPITLTAATFAGPDPRRAAVLLTLGLGIDLFGPSGASGTPIEIVASAFDPAGRAQGVARHSLTLPPQVDQAGSSRQFDAQSRLDLPPGEYEIRVAVAGPAGPASVFTYVTVLPFGSVPLSLSSIVVVAGPNALVAGADLISPLLPAQPTARRTFRQGEPILALLRIHQGTGRTDPLAKVEVRFAITDAGGKQVGASAETLEASHFGKDRSADHFVKLPETLPPGDYLLTVETSLGPRTAGRAMRFTIEH